MSHFLFKRWQSVFKLVHRLFLLHPFLMVCKLLQGVFFLLKRFWVKRLLNFNGV